MERVRLLLLFALDDHVLFRESLSRLVASEPDFEVAGQHSTSSEALNTLRATTVDVVLLDWTLGKEQGAGSIAEARRGVPSIFKKLIDGEAVWGDQRKFSFPPTVPDLCCC